MEAASDSVMEQLVRARGGDAEALDQLMQRVLPDVRAYVRLNADKGFRAQESVSDIVQTVCRQVLHKLDQFEGDDQGQFRSWLFTVALNKIRSRARFYRAERRDAGREDGAEVVASVYGTFCTPSRQAAAREELERVETAFDQLPEDYRQVISMACVAGIPHARIAEAMGRPETAVRKLLSRARARLGLLLTKGRSAQL